MPTKREWPRFLENPATRASHITILVVTASLLILALALLPWAILRCNDATSVTTTNKKSGQIRRLKDNACHPTFEVVANELVDAIHKGYHWIGPGQSIMSRDCRFELGLTTTGVITFYDHEDETILYQSNTLNVGSPGTRLLVGVEGYLYLIRDDGSRATENNDTKSPWQSPNFLPPFFRDPSTGSTFYVTNPFVLAFYDYGIYLYSDNLSNLTNYGSTIVPLWWIGSLPPPNAKVDVL